MTELREYYVVKERQAFFGSKMHEPKAKTKCIKNSPICYLALEQYKMLPEKPFITLRTNFILSNLKMEHFPLDKRLSKLDISIMSSVERLISEDDLLIERQRHVCEQRDEDLERMKAEVHDLASKQLANHTVKLKGKNQLKASQFTDTKSVYEQYISKKNQETHQTMIVDDLSDSSHMHQSQEGEGKHDLDSCKFSLILVYQSEYNIDRLRSTTQIAPYALIVI
jgi:hypothetical protein